MTNHTIVARDSVDCTASLSHRSYRRRQSVQGHSGSWSAKWSSPSMPEAPWGPPIGSSPGRPGPTRTAPLDPHSSGPSPPGHLPPRGRTPCRRARRRLAPSARRRARRGRALDRTSAGRPKRLPRPLARQPARASGHPGRHVDPVAGRTPHHRRPADADLERHGQPCREGAASARWARCGCASARCSVSHRTRECRHSANPAAPRLSGRLRPSHASSSPRTAAAAEPPPRRPARA